MSLGSYKKIPVSELLKMIGGPVVPSTLANRRAQKSKPNAPKLNTPRPPKPNTPPKPNINTLIKNANNAYALLNTGHTKESLANHHKKRNLVVKELGRANKTPRINEILRNINKRKNAIAKEIDWADKQQRWWSWQQIVAAELGGGQNSSTPSKPRVNNRPPAKPWKTGPPGVNTASIARYLAARGL